MATIDKSIEIFVPLKDVYDWVQWAPNFIGVWPNLIKTINYTQNEAGLGLHETIYMMSGIQFTVASQDTLRIPYEKIIAESDKPIPSVITWTFSEIPGGMRLGFAADYIVPIKAIRGLTEGIIKRLNSADSDQLLLNVKQELERLHKG